MNDRRTTVRHRPTETAREAERLGAAVSQSLGRDVRSARVRQRLTQAGLAARVGVHQTRISDIELGRGAAVRLGTWVAIGVALGRPLAVSLSKSIDPTAVADAGHLEIQEVLLELAARTGRHAAAELPTRRGDPWRSTDVATRDDPHRVLILAEA